MHPSQPWCAPRPQPSGNPGEDARTRRSQTAAMAPMARGSSVGLGSYGATPGWGAVVFVFVWLLGTLCTGKETGAPGTRKGGEGGIIMWMVGILHRQGGRRAGGVGTQRRGPPDPQGHRRSLVCKSEGNSPISVGCSPPPLFRDSRK